ncbi:MAG: hypothetical protein ACKV2T_21185 [Kofleriaceae bacterium]
MRSLVVLGVLGCGSTAPTPTPTTVTEPTTGPSANESAAAAARAETARRAELSAAHRKLEDEQATALAASCTRAPSEERTKRCLPSCYDGEPADPRANKKLSRSVEIPHVACTRAAQANAGPFVILDELGGPKLAVRAARRFPKRSKKTSWQYGVEAEVMTALKPDLSPGDVVRVTGPWKKRTHPMTKEKLRCVAVSHFVKAIKRPLDTCGSQGTTACEAAGDAATHGINVVRYRLMEAKRWKAAGDTASCQQAALEAVAVARGMPRWRQYASLNTNRWKSWPRYRTRFDGTLDEDSLFALAIALGSDAEDVHAACGGTDAKTTVDDEQSFHMCW